MNKYDQFFKTVTIRVNRLKKTKVKVKAVLRHKEDYGATHRQLQRIAAAPILDLGDIGDYEPFIKMHTEKDEMKKVVGLGETCLGNPIFDVVSYYFEYPAGLRILFHINLRSNFALLIVLPDKPVSNIYLIPVDITIDEEGLVCFSLEHLQEKNAVYLKSIFTELLQSKDSTEEMFQNTLNLTIDLLQRCLKTLIGSLGILHCNDYFPFVSCPSGNKEIIYLNRKLQTIKGPASEVDIELPPGKHRPHARRGHWRTLSAERYKDHPLYQKKLALYIRPTWVGSEDVNYKGRPYKIMLPKEA